MRLCWDESRQLYRDTVAGASFSLHTQVQVVLAGVPGADPADVLQRASDGGGDSDAVTQPQTLYFRSHLAQAWRRAGRPDAVVPLFQHWFRLLDLGITNWPENDSDQARSDCHAWGCMPEIEMVAIFGLTPAAAGWQMVRAQPQWSVLRWSVPAVVLSRRPG